MDYKGAEMLPFFFFSWNGKECERMVKDCTGWRFALADRGLDYEIILLVTVTVIVKHLYKKYAPDRKGLRRRIILP